MEKISILPIFITAVLKELPKTFRGSHKKIFLWLVLLIALGVGDHKLFTMAQFGSIHVTEWRFRRLLSAEYWSLRTIIQWLADEVIRVLPKPEDATIYLIADGSKKEKRSKKNPFMQKGKIRKSAGWFFGFRFCVLVVAWGNYRIPVDFELLYPKRHKKYRDLPAKAHRLLVLTCDNY